MDITLHDILWEDSCNILIPQIRNPNLTLCDVMLNEGFTKSLSEGKRLIKQNAVSIDGEKIHDTHYEFKPGDNVILKVGKRKVIRVVID